MDTSLAQPGLAENTVVNIQDNSGQIAIGNYIVQIGSVHGGVVNIAMPEQRPQLRPRPGPILLRPRRFAGLLDRHSESGLAAVALPAGEPVEFYGQAGLGKTSLVRHLAYQLPLMSWPDGIVYLSAQQQPMSDLLQNLFDAFYENEIPFKPTEAQLRHALHKKQALILLDDIELTRAEVTTLLDVAPSCAFLLTSAARHLWGEGQAVALAGLPPDDALALLERELDRSLTQAEQLAASVLCRLLDGHPLHLLQAGSLVREGKISLVQLAQRLPAEEAEKALASHLAASLPEPERRVIGLLASLNGAPLYAEHVAVLAGLAEATPILEKLLERKLIQAHSPRYSLTGNLAQIWAQSQDLRPFKEQCLAFFTDWVGQQTPERLLEEIKPILQSLTWAAEAGRWPETLRLGYAIEGTLALAGRWGAWEQTLRGVLQAARGLGNQGARAWALHQLGTRALCLDDVSTARTNLSQALQLREALGDWDGAAITRHNLELLPPPPPTNGQEPQDTPPHSPQVEPLPAVSTSLLQLSLPALLVTMLLTLAILLAVIGGWRLYPPIWSSTNAAAPTEVNVVFVTVTPTAPPTAAIAAVSPTDTPTVTLPPSPTGASTLISNPPTDTATASPTVSPTPTSTVTPGLASPVGPLGCQPPPTWIVYVVQIGDTLNALAARTNTSVFELQQANCLESFALQTGQTIYLPATPPTTTHTPTPTVTPSSTPTRTPTAEQPEIMNVSPDSGEVGKRVIILVEGRNLKADEPDFRVELTGNGSGEVLDLGGLRTSTGFEAIVPADLPVGLYDLFVFNPDNQFARRVAAYEVVELQTPTATPEPVILLDPEQLTFDEQLVGSSSQAKVVTLINSGQGDLLLNDIELSGADPADFANGHNCPARLGPEGRCEITVRFQPTAAGERSATLLVFSNAAGSPHQIPLQGVGRLGQADLATTLLERTGQVIFGNDIRVPVRVVVKNEGDAAAAVFKVALRYTGGNISPGSTFVAAFLADPTDDVEPGSGFYPFTRRELLPDAEVVFEGLAIFNLREGGATVSLMAVADSCDGDESLPDYCRVEESDERNNESEPISVPLSARIE
jgi:LysM repeat protein